MRYAVCAGFVLPLLSWTAFAENTPTAESTPGMSEPGMGNRIAPVLPTLSVSGQSTGKAAFSAGADFTFGLDEEFDLTVQPVFRGATSGGTETVFFAAENSTSPASSWGFGGTVSIVDLGKPKWPKHELVARAKRAAFDACTVFCDAPQTEAQKSFCDLKKKRGEDEAKAACGSDPPSPWASYCQAHKNSDEAPKRTEQQLAEARKTCSGVMDFETLARCLPLLVQSMPPKTPDFPKGSPAASSFEPNEFCESGRELFNSMYRPNHEERARYPRWVLSLGVLGESNRYRYLAPNPSDTTVLSDQSNDRSSIAGGVLFTWVSRDGHGTFEFPASFSTTPTAANTTAKWCVPAGSVSRGSEPMPADPAQSCQELPNGTPSETRDFRTALMFGLTDKSDAGHWRGAFGPVYRYTRIDSGTTIKATHSLGFALPLYINLFNLPSLYVGEYKSLIRMTPNFQYVRKNGSWDPQFLVTLELLTQRTLFAGSLDWK